MLIIDANIIAALFFKDNQRFSDFEELREFILSRRGFLAFGGTKYKSEIAKISRAVQILKSLERRGQIRFHNDAEVDREEQRILQLVPIADCDDHHLIALVCVSKARVVATDDRRADPHLKNRRLYPAGVRKPAIYRKAGKHSRLLSKLPCQA